MKVALFGHSYIRDLARLGFHNIKVSDDVVLDLRYFSFPGHTFADFLVDPSKFQEVIQFQPNIIVVYLGGNDIKVDVELQQVYSDCKKFYEYLRSRLPDTYIIASQIEARYGSTVNRHGSPEAAEFSRLANYFNKWLLKQSFKDRLLCIKGPNKLSNSALYRDTVHLTRQGLHKLFDIIKCVVTDTVLYRLN